TTSSSLPKVVEYDTEVTKDTVPPTNNGSTKDVQPLVVQIETPIPNSEPVFAPIFKDLNFNISFADALILMPKFDPTIKSLLTNKEKLYELARTPLNEHCLVVLLKKLREKLGDPDKFLIQCDFLRMDECLALADLGTGRALIDVYAGELTLRVNNESITFNLDQTSRYSANYNDMMANQIDVIDMACEEYSQEVLRFSNVIASGNPTLYYDPIIYTSSPTLIPSRIVIFLLRKSKLSSLLKMIQLHRELITLITTRRGTLFFLKHFLMMIHHYPSHSRNIFASNSKRT
nr:hypothetical protein [Tanacetum cinerariifolium]